MFVVLLSEKGHMFKRKRLRNQEIRQDGIFYNLVLLPSDKEKWLCKAYNYLQRAKGRVLMPEQLKRQAVFTPLMISLEPFSQLLLEKAFAQCVKRLRRPKQQRAAGILDLYGEHSEQIKELLPHCAMVKVVTANMERYSILQQQAMEEYGASIMFDRNISLLDGCDTALCYQEADFTLLRQPPVVFSENISMGIQSGRVLVVNRPEPAVPPVIAELTPNGIETEEFYGAAVLYNGFKKEQILVKSCLVGGQKVNLEQIPEKIQRHSNTTGGFL